MTWVISEGFHKLGYTEWMVYSGKSYQDGQHGLFGGTPILGNLQLAVVVGVQES